MTKVLDLEAKDLHFNIESRIEALLETWKDELKTILFSVIEKLNYEFKRDESYCFVEFRLDMNNYGRNSKIAKIIAYDKRKTNKRIISFILSVPNIEKVLDEKLDLPIFIDNDMNKEIGDKLLYFEINLVGRRSWKIVKFTIKDIQERLIKKLGNFIEDQTSWAVSIIGNKNIM